jgi:DNA-binding MarR family transcriptional regulator
MSKSAIKNFKHASGVSGRRARYLQEYLGTKRAKHDWEQHVAYRLAFVNTVRKYLADGGSKEDVASIVWSRSSGAEAWVLYYLGEHPNEWFGLLDLMTTIREQFGRTPPMGAMRRGLRRLWKKGHIERHYDPILHESRYRLRVDDKQYQKTGPN